MAEGGGVGVGVGYKTVQKCGRASTGQLLFLYSRHTFHNQNQLRFQSREDVPFYRSVSKGEVVHHQSGPVAVSREICPSRATQTDLGQGRSGSNEWADTVEVSCRNGSSFQCKHRASAFKLELTEAVL